MKGGGENSHPHFLLRLPRKGSGRGGREKARDWPDQESTGPGLGRPRGRAAGPLPPVPSPAGRPAPGSRSALPAPKASPPGPGIWGGGGAGVPRRRILPWGWRRGGGDGTADWRIKDSSSARARPARGILGKKWPRGTRRAPRGAGVRGQGPGARPAEPPPHPHVNAASRRNLFVFSVPACSHIDRAALPGPEESVAPRGSLNPTPCHQLHTTNSTLPLNSRPSPPYRLAITQ